MDKQIKFDKYTELEKALQTLITSPLYSYRIENNYKPVLGEGNLNAKIMFIGEAPGKTEAETGRPFVGAAGKILEENLNKINLQREDVFITSIVQDRPPNNRKPTKKEIEIYKPIILKLIQIIEPKLIVTLGGSSFKMLVNEFGLKEGFKSITRHRGELIELTSDLKILPIFHPAYLLYDRSKTELFEKDFGLIRKYI